MRAFLFPGQGSQSVGMGDGLSQASTAARDVFGEVDEALGQHLFKLMSEGPEDELQLTEIDAQFPADTFFPAWERSRFAEVAREPHQTAEGLRYAFVTYKKLPQGD